ncbi:alpha/beta family hydrolase [Xanthovirga aplysinae]|uniref:alpha/beta family hydrolase n=1 Tax=Xanthovirga aplysinae TaxID=2529853 RepID=UPI0012BC7EFF|nr:alpha/beta family hydrolase [Xanthovirga aplysinae]MTI29801.1 alpha/beta hydrolase [Xanthovirga aplysinae]
MKLNKHNVFRIIWFSLVTVFFIWQWSTYQSRNLPKDIFSENDQISVTENKDEIIFKPNFTQNTSEVIFFQGGLTDPKAYAPLCRKIAENGFTCHLIKMAWRLPQYDYQKVSKLFDLRSRKYIIGGHSQGGKMAAQFVYENPSSMTGLFLMGTSHPRDINLSNLSIPTLKVYAEKDGLASIPEVLEYEEKLPKNSTLILIKGGNHSQFGYLGKLFMDNSADISLENQQKETLSYLIKHFNTIENTF